MYAPIIAIVIFALSYIFILSEKVNGTIIAIIGATALILLGVFTQSEAVSFIDFNTLGLLIGMMIIVSIMGKTGIFQFMAIKIAQRAKGHPLKILFGLAGLTALASAVLPNVTTVLLLTPLVFVICSRLEISPIPFLITEALMANIGGTATLIGDPPNILIGSAANFTFMDFIINLTPVVVVIFGVTLFLLKIIYRKDLKYHVQHKTAFEDIDPTLLLEDRSLLKRSIFVLLLVLTGFLTSELTGLQPATIALSGAGLLLLLGSLHPEHSLKEVEWPVIFFFMGLFVLVGSLEHTGIIRLLAEKTILLMEGNSTLTTLFILWFSGISSGIIDNIPFVATMIPLIRDIGMLSNLDIEPFWWALALGADLGGNITLIGSSSNLVMASQAHKNGIDISFGQFLKVGAIITSVALLISSAYLLLMYI